jgi:hypothetical protein
MLAKFQKPTISFVMFMHLAVCLACMEQLGFHWADFCEVSCCGLSFKYVKDVQVCLKSYRNIGHFTQRPVCFILFTVIYVALKYKGRTFLLGITLLCGSSFSTKNLSFYWNLILGPVEYSSSVFLSPAAA